MISACQDVLRKNKVMATRNGRENQDYYQLLGFCYNRGSFTLETALKKINAGSSLYVAMHAACLDIFAPDTWKCEPVQDQINPPAYEYGAQYGYKVWKRAFAPAYRVG